MNQTPRPELSRTPVTTPSKLEAKDKAAPQNEKDFKQSPFTMASFQSLLNDESEVGSQSSLRFKYLKVYHKPLNFSMKVGNKSSNVTFCMPHFLMKPVNRVFSKIESKASLCFVPNLQLEHGPIVDEEFKEKKAIFSQRLKHINNLQVQRRLRLEGVDILPSEPKRIRKGIAKSRPDLSPLTSLGISLLSQNETSFTEQEVAKNSNPSIVETSGTQPPQAFLPQPALETTQILDAEFLSIPKKNRS